MIKQKTDTSCPCGSGKLYLDCCEVIIDGVTSALSAEALMRSRYSAYVFKNEQYLLDSWNSSTRPDSIDISTSEQWIRLKIINSEEKHVEFIATYRVQGKAHKMHENSRFVFEDGNWFYLDGELID